MKEFIIVGLGLSGASLAYRLEERSRSFVVFDDENQQASKVAGGLMNPVILKRFRLAWKADEQMAEAEGFYSRMEELLQTEVLSPLEIYRRFSSVEEQNNWFSASDKPHLGSFLDTGLVREVNPHVYGKYSFGRILGTRKLEPRRLLDQYAAHLSGKGLLYKESFNYEELQLTSEGVEYRGIKARRLIFCEGFGLLKNPFFGYLPLRGNKGEYIIIRAPELQLQAGIKSSVFIFPAGEDLYAVGATYNNFDKSPEPTEEARNELVEKLKDLIDVPFTVMDQVAGLRPTTVDRRPLVGPHPEHQQLYCSNGFGSRGILLAPMVSRDLLNFIDHGVDLDPEFDLDRFTRKWYASE